ncbi:uncharacterized protein [Eucyclogobius newberryi]|uniref:uncharacterized protein n=1 Tax=Eucyclogobius newberryi TaxID=166745 RepID=UPI003B5BBA71
MQVKVTHRLDLYLDVGVGDLGVGVGDLDVGVGDLDIPNTNIQIPNTNTQIPNTNIQIKIQTVMPKFPVDKFPVDKFPVDKFPVDKFPVDKFPAEKPGVCPKVIMPFAGYDWGQHKEKCTTDWQCPRKQKCCNIGLQRCCVDPEPDIVPEPKCGSCPRPHHCRYCKNDNDCPKSLKCCFNGRKAICTKPVGGCCPPFNVLKHEDECQHDHECPKKLKCCYNKCNRRKTCTEPTKTSNPGCCPGFHKCNTCVHDSDCHGNLKCCPNKCNVNTCTASIKGSCPLIKIMECKDECSDDCDCEKPLKCCYNHCEGRRTCVMPADSNMSSSEESYSVGK